MLGDDLGCGGGLLRELLFQHRRNAGMEALALALEQAAIGSVLDEGVLERVGRVGSPCPGGTPAGVHQLFERGAQLRVGSA